MSPRYRNLHDEGHDNAGSSAAPSPRGPLYWRRVEALEASDGTVIAGRPEQLKEFPDGADVLEMSEMSRRSFLGLMGASLALAGVGTGCSLIRKPAQEILPHARRPEDLIPGNPRYYATSALIGGTVMGLLVESQEGRPTKIEGNPAHPSSLGSTDAWSQAEVLSLYEPSRSGKVQQGDTESTWEQAEGTIKQELDKLRAAGGAGLALLVETRPSPTHRRLLAELASTMPMATLYRHDPTGDDTAAEGAALAGATSQTAVHSLRDAKVILALDADLFGTEVDHVRLQREFADGRRIAKPGDAMNRLYVVEPSFTTTGAAADHRLRAKGRDVGAFAAALASKLTSGRGIPAGAEGAAGALSGATWSGDAKFLDAVAEDLARAGASAVVIAGRRQPARVHALAMLINASLGSLGTLSRLMPSSGPAAKPLSELAAALAGGQVSALVMLGTNPVYTAPADLDFAAALPKAALSVHVGLERDETARLATWHLPASHFLESWGDWTASDGTTSIQQPLIEPLHGTRSEIEVLAMLLGSATRGGYELVRATWGLGAAAAGAPLLEDAAWRSMVRDGFMAGDQAAAALGAAAVTPIAAPAAEPAVEPTTPATDPAAPATTATVAPGTLTYAGLAQPSTAESTDGLEINFFPDPKLLDGRYASNAWLQELPDPMTKITWDNVVAVSPATARELDLSFGDRVRVTVAGRSLDMAALVAPGVADGVLATTLGYGRKHAGPAGKDCGFNTYALRTSTQPWFMSGASIEKTGGKHELACTQDHGTLVEPKTNHERANIVREGSMAHWEAEPEFVREMEILAPDHIKTALWTEPNVVSGQQWGMTVDLSTCTGCNACVIACQSENNVPVVGKERVLDGREMHWLRIDRYYRGDQDNPTGVHQPIPCMQCENAPCEQVCPVAATVHSDDGLNDMVYNRCIGTRYCANNCPYKVRRFNFFNFTKENDREIPLLAMQRNPDVTVRFRGVMEKCTYCVQRIARGRIDAKVHGDGLIKDGAVTTACAQACPSQAIVFGDVNDPATRVSQLKTQSRNYALLAELNTQPRTTFLARMRNPNPALETATAVEPGAAHHG